MGGWWRSSIVSNVGLRSQITFRTQRRTRVFIILVPVTIRTMPSVGRSILEMGRTMGSSRLCQIMVVMPHLANQTLPNVACQTSTMLDIPVAPMAAYFVLFCEEQG